MPGWSAVLLAPVVSIKNFLALWDDFQITTLRDSRATAVKALEQQKEVNQQQQADLNLANQRLRMAKQNMQVSFCYLQTTWFIFQMGSGRVHVQGFMFAPLLNLYH